MRRQISTNKNYSERQIIEQLVYLDFTTCRRILSSNHLIKPLYYNLYKSAQLRVIISVFIEYLTYYMYAQCVE